jgi:hypothetical protein
MKNMIFTLLFICTFLISSISSAAGCIYIASNSSQRTVYSQFGYIPGFQSGCLVVQQDTGLVYEWNGSSYTQVGAGSATVWGTITGTLSNQTDLQTALNAKAPSASPTFTGLFTVNATNALINSSNTNQSIGSVFSSITSGVSNSTYGQLSGTNITSGSENTAVGRASMQNLTTGNDNTTVGFLSGSNFTTGSNNTCVGANAGQLLTTGVNNTLIGQGSGGSGIMTGSTNAAIGTSSLANITSGNDNTGIGITALSLVTTGSSNSSLGRSAGATITTGGTNTLIGYQSDVTSAAATNRTAIGANSSVARDSSLVLGSSAVNVGIGSVTSPTARLHIPAGSATASTAPLKINNGTLLGTPENNAIENDGASIFYTNSSGSRSSLAVFESHVSAACTTASANLQSTTFTNFDNSPTLTFTPTRSGTYKVYSMPMFEANNTAPDTGVFANTRIANTAGGATLLTENQAGAYSFTGGSAVTILSITVQSTFTLTAGVSYSFDIQGKWSGAPTNSSQLRGDISQFYIYAERIN